MKLAVVIPVLNQFPLAQCVIDFVANNLQEPADLIILDNASDKPFEYNIDHLSKVLTKKIIRLEHNIGVYPTFWEALKYTNADVLAFFHSDLFVNELGWDKRVLSVFESHPKLGLVGFIGSNEIDSSGGRGLGTTSNFMGDTYKRHSAEGVEKSWTGSPADAHGKRNTGLSHASVVDGCSMIFRREVLEKIKQRENFPPHHFYDRMLSCETREAGYDVGVLGIGCDHISGQTVNQENSYKIMAAKWLGENNIGLNRDPNQQFMENPDMLIYREAERQWLYEYRDVKHLVPCRI